MPVGYAHGIFSAVGPAKPFGEMGEKPRPATRTSIRVGWLAPSAAQRARTKTSAPLAVTAAVGATLTAPFTECPAVGADTSCGLLIDVTDSGTVIFQDPTQGPYDGIEDTLIGVFNGSSKTLGHLSLASNTSIFGFDGDGICSGFYGLLAGCPFGASGYEGPGTSFSEISPELNSGVVSFTEGIPPGGTAYFSLEEPLSASSVVTGGPSTAEQGGAPGLSEHATTCHAGQPVNCATGTFWHEFTDASIPGRGVPLKFTRTYSSSAAEIDGPLGFGWTDSYNMALTVNGSTGAVIVQQEDGSAVTFLSNGAGGFTAPPRVLATLVHNEDGTYTFSRYADHIQYVFSEAGQLLREADRNGNTTVLTYAEGHLASVTDPSGRSLTFTYTGSHISSVTDPLGRATSFTYDENGNLISSTDALGRSWSFTYDPSHLLLSMTDPRGGTTTNTYDSSNRVTAQVDAAGRQMTWSYSGDPTSPAGSTTTVADARGNVTVFDYANLELMSVTHGAGTSAEATTRYQYDPTTLGRTAITDPDGNVTRNVYDTHGNLLSTADPLGRTTYYSYDALDDLTSVTDPRDTTTSYTYDGSGNLLSRSTPLTETGQVAQTTYEYGAAPGEVTAVTDPNGKTNSFTYDSAGDRTSVTDPDGNTTTYTYNGVGERTTSTSPNGNVAGGDTAAHTTSYVHDAGGELTGETDPLGHTTNYAYDGDGNRVSITDANGHTTQQTYDADNELVQVTRPDGSTLKTEWDQAGNMTAQVDGAGHTTSYSYDPLNRLIAVTDSDGHTTSYGYDLVGRKTSMVNAEGQTTNYYYDAAGEMAYVFYSDGRTPNVSENYDVDGNRITLTDGSGTSSFTYDSLNRMTSAVDGSGATASYGYDLAGHLTGLTYPNGQTVNRGYDSAGNLTSVTDWLGHTTHFSYDANSNLTGNGYPNGVDSSLAYDDADHVTAIADTNGGNTLANFNYTRDAVAQVAGETINNGSQSTIGYTRNALDQLTTDNQTPYGYDTADNPTTFGSGTTETFDPANELVSSTTPSIPTEKEETPHEGPNEHPNEHPNPPLPPTPPRVNVGPSGNSGTGGASSVTPVVPSGGVQALYAGRAPSPMIDAVVGGTLKRPDSKLITPKLRTHGSHDLVLAFISVSSPATGGQRVKRVSGDGLLWSLVGRSSTGGAAEVWQAHASRQLHGPIAAQLRTSGPAGITVAAFSGSAPYVEAHATSQGHASAPTTRLTAPSGSLLWAVGHSSGQKSRTTPSAGQRLVSQFFDTRTHTSGWVQQATATSSTSARIADKTSSARWGLVAIAVASRQAHAARTSQARHLSAAPLGLTVPDKSEGGALTGSQRVRSATASPSGSVTHQFTYNARGDRIAETTPGAATLTLNYDQADRLVDVDGTISYAYNGDDMRVSKTVDGTTTQFVWNRAEVMPELLQDGVKYYIYGPNGIPIEQIYGSTPTYIHQDQQGSTRLITDVSGDVVGRYNYDAWGNIISHTGSATTNLQYDGQYTDEETGYQYLRARYYDPLTGQFLSQDPVFIATQSRYGYGENDPLDLADPLGLWPGSGLVHGVLDTLATIPYGIYYWSYNTAKEINSGGCNAAFGPAEPVTCGISHVLGAPFTVPEALGLGGDVAIDQLKVWLGLVPSYYSICDEGQNIPRLPRFLFNGGSTIHNAPGVRVHGGIDFEW